MGNHIAFGANPKWGNTQVGKDPHFLVSNQKETRRGAEPSTLTEPVCLGLQVGPQVQHMNSIAHCPSVKTTQSASEQPGPAAQGAAVGFMAIRI